MLVDLMSGKEITKIPFEREYRDFMSRLSSSDIDAIKTVLNEMIDGDEIHTSGWMPGADWTDTPFEPIYFKAARQSYQSSALCFGLIVCDMFMERPEKWTFGRFEKDGEDIGCRTYFRTDRE